MCHQAISKITGHAHLQKINLFELGGNVTLWIVELVNSLKSVCNWLVQLVSLLNGVSGVCSVNVQGV